MLVKYVLDWRDHPHKDEAWYTAQKARMTKDELAREVDRSYDLSVAAAVFYNEFTNNHVIERPYEFNPRWKLAASFDFGRTCASLLAQLDDKRRLHVFKEIILSPSNTEELANVTKSYLSQFETAEEHIYTCDPAGKSQAYSWKTNNDPVDIEILQNAGFKPLRFNKALRMKERKKEGVVLLKKLLSERIGGEETILIYQKGCPVLVDAMRSGYVYTIDINGDITDVIDEVHPYEDVVDNLRYIAIELYTVSKEPPKKASVIIPKPFQRAKVNYGTRNYKR